MAHEIKGGDFVEGQFRHTFNFAAGPSDVAHFAATGDAQRTGSAPNCTKNFAGKISMPN